MPGGAAKSLLFELRERPDLIGARVGEPPSTGSESNAVLVSMFDACSKKLAPVACQERNGRNPDQRFGSTPAGRPTSHSPGQSFGPAWLLLPERLRSWPMMDCKGSFRRSPFCSLANRSK
ncbi:uncharacterized protein PG986_008585 [Apiospora aurea]|uniref:Uncharacterized protein n=1 Tax=Apiospora aurea TaxID=335848 RepID=A0ABR1Q5Q6_9PEZI